MRYHKHNGVKKMHRVSVKHKNALAHKAHDLELKNFKPSYRSVEVKTETPVVKEDTLVKARVDGDKYINIDLAKCSQNGLRVRFMRGRKEIALQIDK